MSRRRLSSEPACRVCGCTELNACEDGCSWVAVEKRSDPLCSACAGTVNDLTEAMKRATSALGASGVPSAKIERAITTTRAALKRRMARVKAEASNPDPAWGGR
jgi:hypothetical protein